MEPTLRDGDWLLVDPLAPPVVGAVVVAADSRAPGRWIVKRVRVIEPDGTLTLAGDHPAHADMSVRVVADQVRGRAWFRYWPLRRMRRIG